jgi:E3 ubiquitin-protein ligase RFWD3
MAVISTHKLLSRTFGFRKVNLVDPSVTDFIPTNHKGTIRDVKHSSVGMLLSTGDDKTLKLTSTHNNLVVQSYVSLCYILDQIFNTLFVYRYQLSAPSAACSFDANDSNILYCGLTSGTLMIYDIRNTNTHTHMLESPSNLDPIISVVSNPNSIVCTDEWGSFSWLKGSDGDYYHASLDFFDKTKEIDIFGK